LIDVAFYYFVRNSVVALLEALFARIFSLDSSISVVFGHFFLCVCKVSNTNEGASTRQHFMEIVFEIEGCQAGWYNY